MIADMISNKKLNPIVTELFIRSRKLSISIVFIMQSYFRKEIRLKYYIFFYYENPKQKRTLTNCNKLFIRY